MKAAEIDADEAAAAAAVLGREVQPGRPDHPW